MKNAVLVSCPTLFLVQAISIFFCSTLVVSQQLETCTVGTLGERQQNFPASQFTFFLHQSQFDACSGRIRALRFRAVSTQSPAVIHVSFWRPSSRGGEYTSIGKAVISNDVTITSNDHLEYNAMRDNITVQPGDRLGIWMEGSDLRLLYVISSSFSSLFETLSPSVRAATVGTSVSFRPASNREIAVMEVDVILPTSGTVTTPAPASSSTSQTLPVSSTVTTPSASGITVSSTAQVLHASSTVTITPVSSTAASSASLARPTSTSFDHSSSARSSSSTSSTPIVSSSLLPPADTGVPPAPSSSMPVPEHPLPTSTTHLSVSTVTSPPRLTIVTPSSSSLAVPGSQEGVEGFPLIPTAAGAAGGILLIVLCMCVVFGVLLRQWKVKGRPFNKDTPSAGSAVLVSVAAGPNDLHTRAQSHVYHTVDRESQYKSSSELGTLMDRHDSATTRVSRSSSIAANPLYETTNCRNSNASFTYTPSAQENPYMCPLNHASITGTANKRRCTKGERELPDVVEEAGSCDSDVYWSPPSSEVELYSVFQNKKFRMIPVKDIRLLSALGEGQFGTVSQGVWELNEGESMSVAVKALRSTAKLDNRLKFLQEAAIMGQFLHPNIVRLYGVVLRDDPVMIVLELLPEGDLRGYLKDIEKMNPLPPQEMLQKRFLEFSQQVSGGMNYLANKGFIHRDLAARNILMADQHTCKIGDFGMARDLINESVYVASGGRIPVKWTALEALHYQRYSTASDVWSFGILLYEMWALGVTPYDGMVGREVISLLKKGRRLAPPPGCPRDIYNIMMKCWHPEPAYRPTFSTLLLTLNNLYDSVLTWGHSQSRPEYFIGELLSLGARLHEDLQSEYRL